MVHWTGALMPLLPFDLPRLFRLNGNAVNLFSTSNTAMRTYISVLNFRRSAMFAFGLIFGTIFPLGDVKSVVTPGP
jgi:hypothetical protein